jgi:radical SAM protein with 4Fe4S-binding SPASM domain
MRVLISFTAGRDNFREFPEVARLGCELGVSRVWSDREIPSCSEAGKRMLTQTETEEYLQIMALAKSSTPNRCRTEIALNRALQFLHSGDSVYRCTAGDSLITVMPDGTVYPCRRLPIPIGNVYEQGLAALYDTARMREVRTVKNFQGCEHCSFAGQCKGGLRCLAWAAHGLLDVADPGCPLASQQYIPVGRS